MVDFYVYAIGRERLSRVESDYGNADRDIDANLH